MNMEFVLTLLPLFSSLLAAVNCRGEFYNITRSTTYLYDKFRIPSLSTCISPRQLECNRFHVGAFVSNMINCECSCPYIASTFGFYSGSWTCLENTEVRKRADCTYNFQSEYHDSYPLQVLNVRTRQRWLSLPSDSCTIDIASSRYLKCDGTWTGLGLSESSEFFQLKLLKGVPDYPWDYTFKITGKIHLTGRIIKLRLNCKSPSKSSCLLFKIEGKLSCPVDPTKKSKSVYGESGASSGTIAAIVIVIILVIIVAVIIAIIFWKRKRGENVWIMDRIAKTARRVRPSPKTKEFEEEPQEQVYAEIPEQPTQTPTGTKTNALLTTGAVVREEPPTDDDGYLAFSDSPSYAVLEDPNQQSTDDGEGNNQQEHFRGADVLPVSVSGPSDNAEIRRYVTTPRRPPPPRPPRKERQHDVNDGTDVSGQGEGGSDEKCDYESLKEDNNRDVYQALDRSTMTNR